MDEARLENLFLLRVGEVFRTFAEWYPAKADGFAELFGKLIQWSQGGEDVLTMNDKFNAGKLDGNGYQIRDDAQAWCERMSAHVLGMARIVALDYPDLGEALLALSHHVGDVMNEYRRRIGARWEWMGGDRARSGRSVGNLLPLPTLDPPALPAYVGVESVNVYRDPRPDPDEATDGVPLPTRERVHG